MTIINKIIGVGAYEELFNQLNQRKVCEVYIERTSFKKSDGGDWTYWYKLVCREIKKNNPSSSHKTYPLRIGIEDLIGAVPCLDPANVDRYLRGIFGATLIHNYWGDILGEKIAESLNKKGIKASFVRKG